MYRVEYPSDSIFRARSRQARPSGAVEVCTAKRKGRMPGTVGCGAVRRLVLKAAAGVAVLWSAAVITGVSPATAVPADAGGIPLPDPAASAPAVDPTALLGPDRPNEVVNRSPGPIDDDETVTVG